jgi:hypothetical protein
METENSVEKTPDFSCKLCDYTCSKKYHLDQHNRTKSHKIAIGNIWKQKIVRFACHCGKEYKSRAGLWKHNTKCEVKKNPDSSLIQQLFTENKELRDFIIEQSKEHCRALDEHKKETVLILNKVVEMTKPNNVCVNTNTNTNSNNKAFNINLFLNEKCKDAINFSDFIKSIEVSHEDLENNAQLGFVSGISKILLDQLKQMTETERPIHCTDAKRETMYVKDDDKWEKDEENVKLTSAIREVSRKSLITLMGWKDTNDDYKDMDSEFSNKCIKMQLQSVAGYNRDTYYPKVVKNIVREIIVNKDK